MTTQSNQTWHFLHSLFPQPGALTALAFAARLRWSRFSSIPNQPYFGSVSRSRSHCGLACWAVAHGYLAAAAGHVPYVTVIVHISCMLSTTTNTTLEIAVSYGKYLYCPVRTAVIRGRTPIDSITYMFCTCDIQETANWLPTIYCCDT